VVLQISADTRGFFNPEHLFKTRPDRKTRKTHHKIPTFIESRAIEQHKSWLYSAWMRLEKQLPLWKGGALFSD
jgi:hypothetical protein